LHLNFKAEGIPFLLLALLAVFAIGFPNSQNRLKTKGRKTNILITGATGGLGLHLIKLFEEHDSENINLILVDKSKEKFESVATELSEMLQEGLLNFKFFHCDLENSKDIEALWSSVTKEYGVIHMLVNNAAIARGKTFREMTVAQYKQTIDINLISYVHLTHLFLF